MAENLREGPNGSRRIELEGGVWVMNIEREPRLRISRDEPVCVEYNFTVWPLSVAELEGMDGV